jgi:ABC-2 type transport system permease protein
VSAPLEGTGAATRTTTGAGPSTPLVSPANSGGLLEVFRRRYLLKLLVRKELQARYQGSFLGLMWSYVQPLVRFSMYFFVIGLLLGLHESVPNFAIHMFCAIVFVSFFTETFSSGTRSIVRNKAIVRKMAMPREMFPVASAIVSAIHTFPQLVILFIGAVSVGWRPDWQGVGAGVLGFAIIAVFGTALALLFSALNVFFRDFQNIVSTIQLFMHWAVPMIYPFSKLAESGMHATIIYPLYMSNPLVTAVLLLQRLFWIPTLSPCGPKNNMEVCLPGGDAANVGFPDMPGHFFLLGWVMLGVSLVVLALCQLAFTRLEGKITERL